MTSRRTPPRKRIDLALQGGGSHGAFTWGVLDRLLEEEWLEIAGVSEVRFTPDGLVAEHVDHWDAAAQVYARLPGLGAALRFVRARLSAGV